MPARFDDAIPFSPEGVVAIGPEHPREKIKEIRAWVYQPPAPGGAPGYAAATGITTRTDAGRGPDFLQIEGDRWLLPLRRISAADFREGRAYANAIALISDRENDQWEWVVDWSQPVELQNNPERVTATLDAVSPSNPDQRVAVAARLLGGDGALAVPLKFTGTP